MTNRPDLEAKFRTITIRTENGPPGSDVSIQKILSKFDTPKKRKEVLYALCLLSGIDPMPQAKDAKKV